jgi:hypothetical protein
LRKRRNKISSARFGTPLELPIRMNKILALTLFSCWLAACGGAEPSDNTPPEHLDEMLAIATETASSALQDECGATWFSWNGGDCIYSWCGSSCWAIDCVGGGQEIHYISGCN